MSGLFQTKDSLANKVSYYHMMLLMASLPFDRFYSHLIFISYSLHTLIQLKRGTIKPVFKMRTVVLQSVFFTTLISAIYSINPQQAANDIGKQVTIFLFPVFFCLNPLDIKKYRAQLLLCFAVVCTMTVVYLYAEAFVTIRHYKLPLSAIFSSAFINHNFSEPIDMHATFFSLQLVIALVYMFAVFIKEKRLYYRIFYLFFGLVLLAGLIQLSSKSVLMVLFIAINVAVPYFLFHDKNSRHYIMLSASLSLVFISAISYSHAFRDRFLTELKIDISKATANETTDGRFARWQVVTGLINQKPIIGYGSGSEIGLLQDGFYSHKLYNSYLNSLNSHNEYLSMLLKSGIIGFLVYVATLLWGFNLAFKQKDLLFFTFMMTLALVSISENVLDVDKGIFFYAFFYTLFSFSNESPILGKIASDEPRSAMSSDIEYRVKLGEV